ncbi:MAG: DEAD/DEAH box helicase family protein [Candidatus Micrarchaeota archaeon]|nr:DEAD/DEAH box helicase family protein [Candidatus Micrarchaeota archaeon]MDE1859278.1 DEAD/DEAH box helicase family protein [Candidatus Micrarchaeota archaeon]
MAIDNRWEQLGSAASLIKLDGIEFREYQLNIIKSVLSHGNTLVVLPTGLGKTFIGIGIIANALSQGKRAVLLAPTKPLAEQHYGVMANTLNIPESEILLLTGSINKKSRSDLQRTAKIIIATPQTVSNDLKNSTFSMDQCGVVIFDECHKAVGKYAYTYIANECNVRDILVVGLTASPGSKKEKINALVKALEIKRIEARVSTDADVARYVKQKNTHIINVELTTRIKEISALLKPEIESNLRTINNMGFLHFKDFEYIPKGRLIDLGNQLSKIQAQNYRLGAMFTYSKLINLMHSYDLLNTEGIYPFYTYIESLYNREKKSKSLESLLKSRPMLMAKSYAETALKNGEEHPKVIAVLDIIKDYRGRKVIVFAQYRSTVKMLVEFISNNGFRARAFVGKKEGITQAQQKTVIQDFREGKIDVLVASSIGEEGIDIPGVDAVLFYEPIANEIRNIQRRGRTGRFATGEIYIISANGTKDQIYLRVSQQKEMRMISLLNDVNIKLQASNPSQGQSLLK